MTAPPGRAGSPREVLVVRHGEAYNTVAPDGRRAVPDPSNPPLTARGEAQAALVATVVSAFAPDVAVSSPFLRAAQTGAAALADVVVPAELDVRLCEHFVYDPMRAFAGIDLADYRARFGGLYAIDDALGDRASYPPFPEDDSSVTRRIASLADGWRARHDWSRAVFVGHGATVSELVRALVPSASVVAPDVGHCSVTRLVERPDGEWDVVWLFDVAHLAAGE
ncbi:histidine phosphatase family protein [Luteimicrobium sp. NPDC057192]|uniref:histidine phosphatase family protein n=1 Tax=Luteimicrobium sp. NPDC057192 TaxID=3346042 RepID=UPI00363F23A8